MVLLRLAVFCLGFFMLGMLAHAQSGPVYQGPIPARLGEMTVPVPVTVFAEPAAVDPESLLVSVYARTADLAPVVQEILSFLADEKISACEFRIRVPETNVGASGTDLVISAQIDAEIWVCSVIKTRLGGESARIVASAQPGVRNGRLFLQPGSFRIEGISDIIASIGGDRLLKDLYVQSLERFNSDARLTSLPRILADAGFAYTGAEISSFNGGEPMIRITLIGPNDSEILGTLISRGQ
ncbi:MAG: hypothetical protein AAF724_12980 [Pseudomonadota bacterium]